jgi:hypothetical protein
MVKNRCYHRRDSGARENMAAQGFSNFLTPAAIHLL